VAQTILCNKLNRRIHSKHKNLPIINIIEINFCSSVGGYKTVVTVYIYIKPLLQYIYIYI
jgi:hypothetical protein